MLAPFVACMVLVGIHSYLGLHVIAREVIFVDLSLAQMAALGSIIWVTWPTIAKKTVAYAALGLFHYVLRHRFLTVSFRPEVAEREGWKIKWWDFWFYISFGVAVTISVPLAGVLMVFTMLVVPATIAFLFTRDIKRLVLISWGSGALASLLGLWVSYVADLPTGPLIVCMYGFLLVVAGALRKLGVARVAGVTAPAGTPG